MDPGTLIDAIGQVYASMFDDDAERDWMDLVRDRAGAEHAILSDASGATLVVHASRMDAGMMPLALQLSATTMYDSPLTRMPMRTVQRMSDYLPTQQLLRTDTYHQLVRPLHGGHALAFPWCHGPGRAAIAICRDATRAHDFSDDECAILQPLLRHVHVALGIRAGFRALQASIGHAHGALDAMHEATFIVDRSRRVRYMNPCARALVEESDGVCLDGLTLRATRGRDAARLDGLIDSALGLAARLRTAGAAALDPRLVAVDTMIAIPREAPRRPLLVSVAPATALASGHGQSRPGDAAILLVRDPDSVPACSMQALETLFGLTPREAELGVALREGCPLPLAAARLGVTVGTARQYLKKVFAKTGVSRQSELVGLLRNIA